MKAKVLLVHNHYQSSVPSGEAQVVAVESALLRKQGHDVAEFFRSSDELVNRGIRGKIRGALSTPWNPFSAKAIRHAVDSFSPDIVHVHNTFPLISPSVFHAVGSRAARVLTLHNYRLFCSAAIPMRNGNVCTECIRNHSVKPALRHGCYRGSRIATFPVAFGLALHRSLETWTKQIDAFIALTDFQRDLMIDGGLPAEFVHVKPNFYPGLPAVIPWSERSATVVFAGRLTAEKGLETLLEAWSLWGTAAPELRIIGDGELRDELKQLTYRRPKLPIRFLGQLSLEETHAEIARASLLLLPSQCFEGFPMVLREAFAFGTPVAVSDIGPLPSIVNQGGSGVVFSPADPVSLQEVVKGAWESKGELQQFAANARKTFEKRYTETTNYNQLMEIYEKAKEVSRNRKVRS